MIRRLASLALATGAAMALLSAPAGATTVDSIPASILACHNADAPTSGGGWVHGKGWGDCQQSVDVFVQRFGWTWEIYAEAHYNGPGSAVASYNCSGTGHYSYRTLVQWYEGSGTPRRAISEERRFNC